MKTYVTNPAIAREEEIKELILIFLTIYMKELKNMDYG